MRIARAGLVTWLLAAPCAGTTAKETHNVLLISIDTLRADHLGCYGYERSTTPSIDALARQGTLFENAFTSAPLTLPAHTSLLTGLYPTRTAVRDNGFFRAGDELVLLSESLKAQGFKTAAFVSGFPLNRRFGLDQGFDVYDDRTSAHGLPAHHYPERPAVATAEAAVNWLRGSSSPFFLFVHLFDPHAPYRRHDAYPELAPYDAEIAYADAAVGRLVAAMDDLNLREKTLIVVTADHGESLGEHGEPTHGVFLYDSTLRVPLIICGAGSAVGSREKKLASLVDVYPTVLSALRIPLSPGLDGRELFSGASRESIYAESFYPRLDLGWSELRSIRTPSEKLVEAPRAELYRLLDDPREQHNRLAVDGARAESLRKELALIIREERSPIAPAAPDTETREALRSLGYVQAGTSSSAPLPDPKDRVHLLVKIDEAVAAIEKGDLAAALCTLRETFAADPRSPEIASLYADLLDRSGAPEESCRFLATTRNLRYPRLLLALARCQADHGAQGEARETLRDAAAAGADDAQVANETAITYALEGNRAAAVELFERALHHDPNFVEAWINLGHLHNQEGRYGEASACYDRALAIGEPTASLLNGAAIAALNAGDPAKAESLLRSSLALEPGSPVVELNLARVLAARGKKQEALGLVEEVLRLQGIPAEITTAAQALLRQLKSVP